MRKAMTVLAAAVLLAGCGDTSKVDKLIEQQENSSSEATSSAADESSETDAVTEADSSSIVSYAEMYDIHAENDGFDVDLTILDAQMTYAQVYDMVYNPSLYEGKKVRAIGNFAHTAVDGKDYFAVLIKDATACCAQGLEFQLQGDHVYPDDYPAEDTPLIVWGDFESYEEGGYSYITLKNAMMVPAAE